MACALLSALPAQASDLGVVGLLDTPSARMREEGDLNLGYSSQKIASIFAITYQPTPWLETSFRYTIFNPWSLKGSSDSLRDRSFEAKVRLWKENREGLRPQVSVGVRDLLGTGVFSSEYLVATKAVGPLDLSLGMGWGRFADRDIGQNPLVHLSDSFRTRSANTGLGGKFSVGNYFAGPRVGMFGGMRYSLPRWNLDLLAEYNSDAYRREVALGTVDETDPWSFGIEWEPSKGLKFGLSWQQGNQIAARIGTTISTSQPARQKLPNGYGAAGKPAVAPVTFSSKANWYQRMSYDARTSGVLVRSATPLDETTLNVVYTNQAYQYEADAIHRVLALAELYAPRQYRRIILTSMERDALTHSISYLRSGQAAWASEVDLPESARQIEILPPLRADGEPEFRTKFRYPNVAFSYSLSTRTYLFDPDDPFRFQTFARVNADVGLGAGFALATSWSQNLYDQFGGISRTSDSVLPHVRSDSVRYLKEGKSGLERLALTRNGQLGEGLYYKAFAGYLEEMYAGVGAEVLYRPFGSRVAVGANVIAVRQRDFDKKFGFRDYQTVIGHVSAYWASPIYDFDVEIDAGRYLAKDWGATLSVSKRFANGWSVGAFATLTDVPFSKFGEGSFDKGLVFTIPFNSYTGFNTRAAYRLIMRPIQRDGGQRLNDWGTSLWDDHRGTSFDYLSEQRERMVP